MVLRIFLQAALWIWFLGCTFTYRIGKQVLVEGMGFKSVEFRMLCAYTLALILFYAYRPVGKGLLFAVLLPLVLQHLRRKRAEAEGVLLRFPRYGPDFPGQRYEAGAGPVPYRFAYPDCAEYCLGIPVKIQGCMP